MHTCRFASTWKPMHTCRNTNSLIDITEAHTHVHPPGREEIPEGAGGRSDSYLSGWLLSPLPASAITPGIHWAHHFPVLQNMVWIHLWIQYLCTIAVCNQVWYWWLTFRKTSLTVDISELWLWNHTIGNTANAPQNDLNIYLEYEGYLCYRHEHTFIRSSSFFFSFNEKCNNPDKLREF